MQSQKALIERSNRQALKQVDVRVTVTDSTSGRQSWRADLADARQRPTRHGQHQRDPLQQSHTGGDPDSVHG